MKIAICSKMSFLGVLDLNSAPIDALAVPDANLVNLSFFEEQVILAAPSVLEPQQQVPGSNSAPPATTTLQAESGGVTVPTTDTAADAIDVENGVEMLPEITIIPMLDILVSPSKLTRLRIDTSRESKRAGEKTKYIYVCQKVGVNKKEKVADDGPITEKKIVRQRRKDYLDRTHCPARMIVRKTAPGQWEVVHFEKERNHDRLRKFSLKKYLKSHRDIPAEEKEFIKLLQGCCITTTRAYQILAELYGGIENCPYTEGGVKNLRVEYRAEYKGKDDRQEANTTAKVPHYLTGHPMKRQMKKAYTRKLFNVFQHELQLSSSYYVVRVEGDELIDVVPYKHCPDPLYGTRTFRVTVSRSESLYSCTCCKFQRDGVLCCHVLKVFDALAVHEVPSQYILPRWSVEPVVEDAVEVATEPLQESQITSHGKHIVRYSRMCTDFNKIVRPFMVDDKAYGIVSKQVGALQTKLTALRKRRASTSRGAGAEIGDPPITKKQGRLRSKRYETGLGLVPPKKPSCSYCGSAEHTTTACSPKPARKHTKELVDRPLKEAVAA
ncbi:hypothetical protein C2845_PM01G07430 [Panicum miliaceum]|uniref:SWIM-type domain-containing protein n=1 Tax=Panicum miliaceum TaxID=4540 RepID=A0A3L6TFN6_PANMI|nr:hypothetical protein C2845_PM01G07430 [Panicum miliaceum]